MAKKRIVVICPGRGTYTRETSGYLNPYDITIQSQIKWIDKQRKNAGLQTISELDASTFKAKTHMVGENAAEIIQMASIAISMGAKKSDFDKTMALHPTIAEEFVTMP